MKVVKVCLLAVALAATLCANALESDDKNATNPMGKMIFDAEISSGMRFRGLQQAANGALDLGFCFAGKVYPYVRYESGLMLYKHDGQKIYGNTYNLGGGFGIVLSKVKHAVYNGKASYSKLEFTANVTSSVGGKDYKNTSDYDGIRWRFSGSFVGIGFRNMHSRTASMPDYRGIILSIGF